MLKDEEKQISKLTRKQEKLSAALKKNMQRRKAIKHLKVKKMHKDESTNE